MPEHHSIYEQFLAQYYYNHGRHNERERLGHNLSLFGVRRVKSWKTGNPTEHHHHDDNTEARQLSKNLGQLGVRQVKSWGTDNSDFASLIKALSSPGQADMAISDADMLSFQFCHDEKARKGNLYKEFVARLFTKLEGRLSTVDNDAYLLANAFSQIVCLYADLKKATNQTTALQHIDDALGDEKLEAIKTCASTLQRLLSTDSNNMPDIEATLNADRKALHADLETLQAAPSMAMRT